MSKALTADLDTQFERSPVPPLRRKPSVGSIFRMPLRDGAYAYALTVHRVQIWVFDFLTKVPAVGSGFFPMSRLRHAVWLGDVSTHFVDCGTVDVSEVEALPEPKFYWILNEDYMRQLGFKSKYGTCEGAGIYDSNELTMEDIVTRGLHRDTWLEWHSYEKLIGEWLPSMSVREVPEEFIDHEALRKMAAGEPVEEKPLPQPRKVEFLIVFQSADLESDDPELDLEEPLEEALGDSGCGDVAGSGTAPGVFEINVETSSSDRARCLAVIRRVLKKAKAPASTIIKELCEPPIDHPLEAPVSTKKKKRR